MTISKRTQEFYKTIKEGTVITKRKHWELSMKQHEEEGSFLVDWQVMITKPEKYGFERIEEYNTTTSSKYSVTDVIEMMKKGMTIEEIEQTVSTQVKTIKLKKI